MFLAKIQLTNPKTKSPAPIIPEESGVAVRIAFPVILFEIKKALAKTKATERTARKIVKLIKIKLASRGN